jgi:hypothetical protein
LVVQQATLLALCGSAIITLCRRNYFFYQNGRKYFQTKNRSQVYRNDTISNKNIFSPENYFFLFPPTKEEKKSFAVTARKQNHSLALKVENVTADGNPYLSECN